MCEPTFFITGGFAKHGRHGYSIKIAITSIKRDYADNLQIHVYIYIHDRY